MWEKTGQSFIFNLTAPSAPWKHFFMARPLRTQYPGVWYHVTSRGNDRKRIFADNPDRKKFLEMVAGSVESFCVQVHSCVLMAIQCPVDRFSFGKTVASIPEKRCPSRSP